MKRRRKQVIAVVVAAGIAAGGAGGALAHDRPGTGKQVVRHAFKHRAGHGLFKVVTDYLGLTPQALFERLRAGKSLAQIAVDQGRTADGLKQTILGAIKVHLDKAVAAGRLSADREQMFLTKLSTWLDTFLNKTWTKK